MKVKWGWLPLLSISCTLEGSLGRDRVGSACDDVPLLEYEDVAQLAALGTGARSHHLQPWRGWVETVPARTYLDGLGVGFNYEGPRPDLLLEMLARHGISQVKIELGWGHVDPNDETRFSSGFAEARRSPLAAAAKLGVRPTVLAWAHSGVPCPLEEFAATVLEDAPAGSTTLRLDDVSRIVIGFTGLSNVTDYWAAEVLVVAVEGDRVQLSKPLPKPLNAGDAVTLARLYYRPFSAPGTPERDRTMAGWLGFLDVVADFVSAASATPAGASDRGFDVEIWNVLRFGSHFLYIDDYYAAPPLPYDRRSIHFDLIAETADHFSANPARFAGVALGDGFANESSIPAASTAPARLSALGKHHWPPVAVHPDSVATGFVDVFGQPDDWQPSYTSWFPEHGASMIDGDGLMLDLAPVSTEVDGVTHGRKARTVDGEVLPMPVWITEQAMRPADGAPMASTERALMLKAKLWVRATSFWLNKGVTRVYAFDGVEGDDDLDFGLVRREFVDAVEGGLETYPEDDSSMTSPALLVQSRVVNAMREGLEDLAGDARNIALLALKSCDDGLQFVGDGTPAHPDLRNRDVFAFLPYQVGRHRFVVHYYVMTRDIRQDLLPEHYTLEIGGIDGQRAEVTAYDPWLDQQVIVEVQGRGAASVTISVEALDHPRLLVIVDG